MNARVVGALMGHAGDVVARSHLAVWAGICVCFIFPGRIAPFHSAFVDGAVIDIATPVFFAGGNIGEATFAVKVFAAFAGDDVNGTGCGIAVFGLHPAGDDGNFLHGGAVDTDKLNIAPGSARIHYNAIHIDECFCGAAVALIAAANGGFVVVEGDTGLKAHEF